MIPTELTKKIRQRNEYRKSAEIYLKKYYGCKIVEDAIFTNEPSHLSHYVGIYFSKTGGFYINDQWLKGEKA